MKDNGKSDNITEAVSRSCCLGVSGLLSVHEALRLTIHNPKLTWNLLCDKFRGKRPSFPRMIVAMLTDRCNFACPMCAVGTARKERLRSIKDDMPLEYFNAVVREARKNGAYIQLSGGEPMLHGNLEELLRLTQKNKVTTYLTTNGLLLPNKAEMFAKVGLQIIQISLDGWDEESQAKRGHLRGSYDAIVEGVRKLQACKRGKLFPIIRILTTITKDNFHSINRIQKSILDMGVKQWQISNYFFIIRNVVDAHLRFREETGIGDNLALHQIDDDSYLSPPEVSELKRSMHAVRKGCECDGIRLSYAWATDLDRYYSPTMPSRESRCTRINSTVEVLPDGRIGICNDGLTIGDLRSDTIQSAWHGERMMRFLKLYKERGIFPMCFRCCGICQAEAVQF